MIVTLALAIGSGKSGNLAAAYGIAVSATMLITSMLLFIAMREIWGWPLPRRRSGGGAVHDDRRQLFIANMTKVMEGGYVPLLIAAAVFGAMAIWHSGASAVNAQLIAQQTPLAAMIEQLRSGKIASARFGRVPYAIAGPDAAGHGLARAPESRAARSRCWRSPCRFAQPRGSSAMSGLTSSVWTTGFGAPSCGLASWTPGHSPLFWPSAKPRASTSISPTRPITSA